MKIAILDLGTNTFHLLIAEIASGGSFKILFKSKAIVKLLEGSTKNEIPEKQFQHGIKTIRHFAEIIIEYLVKDVHGFATSAVRSSSNGKDFVELIKIETGISIKVIDGDEEAKLIYYGVRQSVQLGEETALIMDIGGGSTEFIIANEKKVFWKQSYNIGAARLLKKFNPSDPISQSEIILLQTYLREETTSLISATKKFTVKKLIGSSGSFDTLAEMIGHKFYNINVLRNISAYTFEMNDYNAIHKIILSSTRAQRMRMKGLIKMRVDMIVVSSICVDFILKEFSIKEFSMSKFALKEGALWEIIQQQLPVNK
jgi:exopolyphosphatase/guanosine-5'-triphosphate,3'-diphosphate pyrophosphatase